MDFKSTFDFSDGDELDEVEDEVGEKPEDPFLFNDVGLEVANDAEVLGGEVLEGLEGHLEGIDGAGREADAFFFTLFVACVVLFSILGILARAIFSICVATTGKSSRSSRSPSYIRAENCVLSMKLFLGPMSTCLIFMPFLPTVLHCSGSVAVKAHRGCNHCIASPSWS